MFRVGDAVNLTFRVVNPARQLVDADVVLTVDRPVGAVLTISSPTRVRVGEYTASFVATDAGRHVARWVATGPVNRSSVEVVNVAPAAEPVAIISLGQAREHLNIPGDERAEDDELQRFIDAASRVVEQYTGEIIARRPVTEECWSAGDGKVLLAAAPIVSLTSVTSLDGTYTYEGSVADSVAGIVSVPGYLYGPVLVTVVAGRAAVPENYQTATAIICAHLWTTQRVPAMGGAPGFGGEAAPTPGRGYLIPNQAAQLLGGKAPNRP